MSLESLTNSTKGFKRDPDFFAGLCRVIEVSGKAKVSELHFDNISILFGANEVISGKESDFQMTEVGNPRKEAKIERVERFHKITEEEQALIEIQRPIMDDINADLELEDPVEADRLARLDAEKED